MYLNKRIMDILREYAQKTADMAVEGTSKKISREEEAALTLRGKYYEVCAAVLVREEVGLPVAVDLTLRKTGDGHKNDLLLPHSTIQIKGRWPRLRPDFILAPRQGTRLLDDIGLVVLGETGLKCWAEGFLTYDEWDDLVETIEVPVGGGRTEPRRGVRGSRMHDWNGFAAAVQTAENRGRERGIRQRLCSGRVYLLDGEVRAGMDDEV